MGALDEYRAKRVRDATPEPWGGRAGAAPAPRYAMQMHDARALHFDLRLEWNGVLLSWAVTKGPSWNPSDKRLSVRTENHPLDYLDFEGVIPEGQYGAGRVMVWDIGHWRPEGDVAKGLGKGHLGFRLYGRRNTGAWDLVRMEAGCGEGRENWLLIKKDDAAARKRDPAKTYRRSVLTGRTLTEIGQDAEPRAFGPDRKGARPRFRKVALARLVEEAPSRTCRWNELKFDGYRALVALGKGGTRIYTRNGKDWSDRFAPLLPALSELPADTALVDGEIVAGAGLDGFSALQKAIRHSGPFIYYVFDLLHLDGQDITGEPLGKRRKALERLLRPVPPLGLVQASQILHDDPGRALDAVCDAGGEGIVSKRVDAPYRGGRSGTWLKLKCERRAEFVVVGYRPSDRRGRPFSSLLLATSDADGMVYRGKVGTGFDADAFADLVAKMKPLRRKTAPLEVPRSAAQDAEWLTPKLVAEIRFTETTGDGLLRHPVFVDLREDKEAGEVSMEGSDEGRITVAGIGVSNGQRIVFPKPRTTKLEVAEYVEEMADRILEEAADRPLSLVRMPEGLEGERFFQKHPGKGFPDALRTLKIEEAGRGTDEYMYATNAAGLVAAVQMGTLEFHIWGVRRDRLDRPDRLVFDLDPDEGLGFASVRSAARTLRDVLRNIGLDAWPLLTGGKGVHVVVPLRRTAGWTTVKTFAQTLSQALAEKEPKRFVATASKAKRSGKVFIDWLRNERGATAIAPFSLRARAGAPVAVPVSWDELADLHSAGAFDIRRARKRGWRDVDRPELQSISQDVVGALEDYLDDR